MSLQDADFVFYVEPNASKQSLSSLVSSLQEAGFQCQAREGDANSTLMFVQLVPSKFKELVQKDVMRSIKLGFGVEHSVSVDRAVLIHSYLTDSKQNNGVGIIPKVGLWGPVSAIMPVAGYLHAATGTSGSSGKSLVLESTASYVALIQMYFEFVKSFLMYLLILSILGVYAYKDAKQYDATFAIVISALGVMFLCFWKAKEKAIAHKLGARDIHKFVSAMAVPIEKRAEVAVDDGPRFFKQWAFLPVALAFIGIFFAFKMMCIAFDFFTSKIYKGPFQEFLWVVPTLAPIVFVQVINIVFKYVVNKHLTWEGHHTETSRYNSFLVKWLILEFSIGYIPLLVTSFVYLPFANLAQEYFPVLQEPMSWKLELSEFMLQHLSEVKIQQDFQNNQDKLTGEYFFAIVIGLIAHFLFNYVVPFLVPKVINFYKEKILKEKEQPILNDEPDEKKLLTEVRHALTLPTYNVHDGFRMLVFQFGYLTMFGSIWTMAPAICLFYNILIYKVDLSRLSSGKYFRPAVPARHDLIHPWDLAFAILLWLGSVISPAVSTFYRKGTRSVMTMDETTLYKASFNVLSMTEFWWTVIFSEHLFLALYLFGLKAAHAVRLPEVPSNSNNDVLNFLSNDLAVLIDKRSDTSNVEPWTLQSVDRVLEQATFSEKISSGKGSSTKHTGASTSRGDDEGTRLRARKGKGDKIIDVVDSQGEKIEAIIDDNGHIPMDDVKAVEVNLVKAAKEGKSKNR